MNVQFEQGLDSLESLLDDALVKNMRELNALRSNISKPWMAEVAKIDRIGRDLDGLGIPNSRLSDAKQFNLLLMRQAKPIFDIAVVASAKNEGPYLVEWVAHNIAVGFEKIFIYTNSNTDGCLELLKELERYGLIYLIENDIANGISPQIKAYEHSIHLLKELRKYKWVAYFDVDEFVIPDASFDFSVRNMTWKIFDISRDLNPEVLLLNWDWYGSNAQIEMQADMVQNRFKLRKDYGTVKSICKLSSISQMHDLHIPDHNLNFINTSGNLTSSTSYATASPDYNLCRLNHYFHKSLSEFAVKKDRGTGLQLLDANPRAFDDWFHWEPIRNVNASELGTPRDLVSRVEKKINEIRSMGDVTIIEQACVAEHKRIAANILGNKLSDTADKLRRHAEMN